MTGSNPNPIWAGAFLDELARAGVREVCVAPGSRSAPLVLAAAQDPRLRLHSIVDERSAGFFALGIGKASGMPAAVVTTSGTAAANLHPAVIEASQGEVPLLLLTADRPHRLRDTDGNQAMDQLRLFGSFPRAFFEVSPPRMEEPSLRHLRALAGRAVAASLGPPPGPVHLNFPFEKPLEPGDSPDPAADRFREENPTAAEGRFGQDPFARVTAPRLEARVEDVSRLAFALSGAARGLIVAGPVPDPKIVAPAVLSLGVATGFPILADPLSGVRFGPSSGAQVVGGYDLLLRSGKAREVLAPELVVRVGASPTSAALLAFLEEHADAHQIVVDDGHRWKDHTATARDYYRTSPADLLDRVAREADWTVAPGWTRIWTEAEARTRQVLDRMGPGELLEGQILAAVAAGLPANANLLVASSMPIRDLDAFAMPHSTSVNVFGNRGASGIDGLVSTAVGIAAASEGEEGPAPPTVGVLGDLAFFHDMNGLLALKDRNLWVVFVVVNNDGGGIFHTLPVREHEPAFTRFFTTPHGLDFEKVADLYGIPFLRTSSLGDFESRFVRELVGGGPLILEVRTDREATHARRRGVVEAVVEAMSELDYGEDRIQDEIGTEDESE